MKKSKIPLSLRLTAWAFPKLEALSAGMAAAWFTKIFFSTVRLPFTPDEVAIADEARRYRLTAAGKDVQVYEWGEGQPVLLVHGWLGKAAQFKQFIPELVNMGYKVISFDATGHGRSEGKSSHLMEFVGVIHELYRRNGKFALIAGHSLGGIAAFHAVCDGLSDRLILINTPTSGKYIINEFRKKLGASPNMVTRFEHYILKKYGRTFESYSVQYNLDKVGNADILIIHDEKDREVSIENAILVHNQLDNAELITTSGLGHTRILGDKGVIGFVAAFANKTKHAELMPVS